MPGGRVGVALFFMISGYFQIYKSTVSVRKVVYETVFYSVLLQLVALILKIGSLGNIARGFFPISSGSWWYVSSYVVLMLCSPTINQYYLKLKRKQKIFMIIFAWVFLYTVPYVFRLQYYSLERGVVFYLIGAYTRTEVDIENIRKFRFQLIVSFVFLWTAYAPLGYMFYTGMNKLFSMVVDGIIFNGIIIVGCAVMLFVLFFRRNRWTIEENFVEIDFGAIKNFWDTVKPELAQEESDSVYETLLSELKKLSLEQLLFVYTIWEYAEIITANRLPNERKLTYLLDNIDIISDGTTDIFKNTMMGIWRFVWDTKNVFLKIYEKGDVKDQAFIELYDKTNIVVAMRETTAMHISGHLRDRMREIMDHFDMSEDVDKTVVMQKKLDFALDMIKNGEVKKTGFIETVNCLNQIIDDKLFMKNIFLLFDNDYRTAMRCIKAICTEHLNEVENAIGLIKADDNHCVFGGRGIIYRLLIDHFFKWKYFDDMGIPSTKYGSSSVLMKPHHGYSYARIILTILCNRQTKNIERFFVNPEESVKLDDLYQMVRNLMSLDQFVTVINGMYSLRNKKFWNHLVTFDNILAYSSTAIKNYIESAEERFNKESSDTRDEREIYIRATTAGQMFASTMCIHFEYFSSRFSTAGISQPLFLYQNLDDKKEYKSMKDTVVAVIEAVKKCIMSLEEYNKIVMKENGASHYSEILESSYYYEGQFHEERIIHNHISYMEAYRKYVLENEKISEHRRIEANDFILDSIEKYLAMLKYNPDNGIKPYRNMFYTENSSNLYNQLMVCIEEIRDKKRYDISITRDYYNANFSGKKCRYMQNLGDVNA